MTVLQEFSKAVQWTQEWNKWTKGILCQRDWTLKKSQIEILPLKDSINRIKNALEIIRSREDHMSERISQSEDRNLEIIEAKEEKELKTEEIL